MALRPTQQPILFTGLVGLDAGTIRNASECMKDFSAGVIAGAIAGFLFPTMMFLVLFLALSGKMDLQRLASRVSATLAPWGGAMSLQAISFFIAVGFVFFSLAGAGLGAILGVVFAKLVNRLPVSSIYLKAFGLGILLYLLVSLPRFVLGRLPDIYILAAIVVDSLIFGSLFVRWTRRPLANHVTKIDRKTNLGQV